MENTYTESSRAFSFDYGTMISTVRVVKNKFVPEDIILVCNSKYELDKVIKLANQKVLLKIGKFKLIIEK